MEIIIIFLSIYLIFSRNIILDFFKNTLMLFVYIPLIVYLTLFKSLSILTAIVVLILLSKLCFSIIGQLLDIFKTIIARSQKYRYKSLQKLVHLLVLANLLLLNCNMTIFIIKKIYKINNLETALTGAFIYIIFSITLKIFKEISNKTVVS